MEQGTERCGAAQYQAGCSSHVHDNGRPQDLLHNTFKNEFLPADRGLMLPCDARVSGLSFQDACLCAEARTG